MIPKTIISVFLTAACIINACTTLKRYNSIESSATDNTLAGIDLFGFSLSEARPEPGIKTLWDLSADAQSQFIKILNARYPDNTRFLEALSFEYQKHFPASSPDDYVNKDLRMVFSVSKLRGFSERSIPPGFDLTPADRIEYLKITLKLQEKSGVRFKGWNRFSTEYGSINIADVSFSRSIEVNTSGLISADNKITSAELSSAGKSSLTRREDQALLYRYMRLNGRINENRIEMEEEGTREIDLTGNIVADVTLEFDRVPEKLTHILGLTDSTGSFCPPGKLLVFHSDAIIPDVENMEDTIFAELGMDYVFRNVIRGQKTFPEWDDRIKHITGSVVKTIPLFTSSNYVPDFYCIGTNPMTGSGDVIRMKAPGLKENSIIFKNRSEAVTFNEWLAFYFSQPANSGKPLRIGGSVLIFRDEELTNDLFNEDPGLQVVPYYSKTSSGFNF